MKGTESRFMKVARGQFVLNDGKAQVAKPAKRTGTKGKSAKAEAKAADETPAA